MSSYLMVIYGTSNDSNGVAWQLARRLPGKSAVLSVDRLLAGAIAQPADDIAAELDMAHTQLRLLVANYMKNGYNVVVEGVFFYERDGQVYRYEQDIDQLVALMRNMTQKALMVHLHAADKSPRFPYRDRYGVSSASVDFSGSVETVAEEILHKLLPAEVA